MNKAFVREPDDTGERRCPRCGSPGHGVAAETLESHLAPEARRTLSEPAFFCPFPKCEVAYFDMFEQVVPSDVLRQSIFPKDPTAPLCSCFGLTPDDVQQDIREGVVTRVKALLARSKTPEARCAVLSPDGRCCAAEVQRHYMKLRAQSQSNSS